MNVFSMEPGFGAVKLSCSEMNKMGFRLAFWEAHPPHSCCTPAPLVFCSWGGGWLPTSLIYLRYRPPSAYFPPHTSPLLTLFPLFLPSTPVSVCSVWARLHGWRKEKERRGEGYAELYMQATSCTDPVGPHQMLALQNSCFCLFLYMHLLFVCVVCGPVESVRNSIKDLVVCVAIKERS